MLRVISQVSSSGFINRMDTYDYWIIPPSKKCKTYDIICIGEHESNGSSRLGSYDSYKKALFVFSQMLKAERTQLYDFLNKEDKKSFYYQLPQNDDPIFEQLEFKEFEYGK